jgi:hypothetical protein
MGKNVVLLTVALLATCVYSFEVFKYSAPKQPIALTAYKLTKPIDCDDGDMNDEGWQPIPWTSDFGDILGGGDVPKFATKAKIAYNDDNLYVGIKLDEPYPVATMKDGHIWKDNSIGIYFDAPGSANLYNQFDINAYKAIYSAIMVDTYKTDINVIYPYNMGGEQGVAVQGHLNDPTQVSTGWSMEIQFPFKSLTQLHDEGKPTAGSIWRMLLSRVEWGYKIVNNTWVKDESIAPWYSTTTPQWSVTMHHPENYNFLQFTDKPAGTQLDYPRHLFEIQQILLWLMKCQVKYYQDNKKYATSFADLNVLPESLREASGADVIQTQGISLLGVFPDPYNFAMSILYTPPSGDPVVWSVRGDYKMWKAPYYSYQHQGPTIAYGVAVTSILLNVIGFLLVFGMAGYIIYLAKKKGGYTSITA